MSEEYSLSVVICAVDETFSLKRTFEKLDAYHAASEYLFVLSKTCTPGCLQTVQDICTRPDCRWMYQSGKGFGGAIRDSFDAVRCTHMIIWSADEGTDVASFPEMVRLSRENPEKIVKISRWLHEDGFEGYGKVKTALNFVSQRAFGLLYGSDLTEFTNPTQIAPVAVYRSIRYERTDFAFLTEVIVKPLRLGVEFIEVPCKNVPRQEGKSHNTFKGYLMYYYVIVKIRFTRKDKLLKEAQG